MVGACVAEGGMHSRGDMRGRGGSICGRRDGNCSGRYASYWNAFLFVIELCLELFLGLSHKH